MMRYILKWEIKKLFAGNRKIIWLIGIALYFTLFFTLYYTVNYQALRETNADVIVHVMEKIIYGGMSIYHAILIIVVISPLFSQEHAANMYAVLRTAKYGNHYIMINKIVAAFICIFMWTVVYNACNYLIFHYVFEWYQIEGLNYYWKIGICAQLFGNLTMTVLCCMVSAIFRNVFSSTSVSAFLIFAPMFVPGEKMRQYLSYLPIWSVQLATYRAGNGKIQNIGYVVIMKGNQSIYPVERYVIVGENKVLFDDGSHIIYVNGKYRGNDEIGKLMHDFSCTNPDDMNYEALAEKARYYKRDEKGVATMCKIMEDMRNEAAREAALDNARETARRMIKKGKMSLEEIADYVPVLSLDELKQLETEIMQMA